MQRGFRDRDYVETREGFFFTVVGNIHPDDRVLAYLKYVKSEAGKWGRGESKYQRAIEQYTIPHLMGTFDFLRKNAPQYLFHSDVHNITFSAVPLREMSKHYLPEDRLAELLEKKELDLLEKNTVELTRILSEESNVPINSFGVTGSLLVGVHQIRFSDIDLTVYGRENSSAVRKTLLSLFENRKKELTRFKGKILRDWCEWKERLYPVTQHEADRIYQRKWNRVLFKNILFSIHPTKTESEVSEKYGERRYTPIQMVEVKARVVDSTDAMFLPATYIIENVEMLSGQRVQGVREIVSFEGLYGDLASEGEEVFARGKLEKVENSRTGETYYRVFVGSTEAKGSDYIKLASWR